MVVGGLRKIEGRWRGEGGGAFRVRGVALAVFGSRSARRGHEARIDAGFARELVEHDAAVLGLDGPSELVREGLRLLHRRAREMDAAAAYDEFYSGKAAPLPAGVVAADPE